MSAALIHTFPTPTDLLLPSLPFSSRRPFTLLRYNNTQTKTKTHFRIFSQTQQQQQETPNQQPITYETQTDNEDEEEEDPSWVPMSEYLIEKLAFTPDQAKAAADIFKNRRLGKRDNEIIFREHADNVVTLFEEYCGIDKSVIKTIVRKFPGVLAASIGRNLRPKLSLLKEAGFTSSDFANILPLAPQIYLKTNLVPVVNFVKEYWGNNERDVVSVCRYFKASHNDTLIQNVMMLENEYGVDKERLKELVVKYPPKFIVKNKAFREFVDGIEERWGISRESEDFLTAVFYLSGLIDKSIEGRFRIFEEFEWPLSDIMLLYKGNIRLTRYRTSKLREALNLYMFGFGFEPAQVARYPKLFSVNLEVVLVRHGLLLGLIEKGLIEADYDLASAFVLTEEEFVDTFVFPYENVAGEICEAYIKDRAPYEELFFQDNYEDKGYLGGESDAE